MQMRDGYRQWEIRARAARLYEESHYALLEDVAVELQSPQWSMRFRADQGKIDTARRDFAVQNNRRKDLAISFSNGYRAVVSSLRWDQNRREATSPGPVRLEGPGVEIKGVGLVADLEQSRIRILQNVRAIFP